MRNRFFALILSAVAATTAAALPSGLSGLGVGFGGHVGDLDQGRIGAQFDFAVPPYVSIGPELMLGFGDNVTTLLLGGESRIYFIPNYNFVVQPYALMGGGYGRLFVDEFDDWNGGYMHFGGGMDFDIPNAPIAPYFNMGALIIISDETLGQFSVEGGVRFNVW